MKTYWHDQSGGSAAEFALIVVPFATLLFAVINGGLMLYAANNLQYATEVGARCAAVMYRAGQSCDSATNIQNYAAARYTGPGIAPSFVYSATGCGHTVTGSGTFPLNIIVSSVSVSLTASACYP